MASPNSIMTKPTVRTAGKDSPKVPENVGQLLAALGGIAPERVRLNPPPGRASSKELIQLLEQQKILCEVVDGTLVDKPVGQIETILGRWLIRCLWDYLVTRDLGRVYGPDTPFQLKTRLIRMPDVAYVSHGRLPREESKTNLVSTLIPDFVVEIRNNAKTKSETLRKVEEFFAVGVKVVWVVDPKKRTVTVYKDSTTHVTFGKESTLDLGDILPGFSLSLGDWFAKID